MLIFISRRLLPFIVLLLAFTGPTLHAGEKTVSVEDLRALGQQVQVLKQEAIAVKRDQILLEYDILPGGRDTAVKNIVPLESDLAVRDAGRNASMSDLLTALARLQVEAQWSNPKLDQSYVDVTLGSLFNAYGLPQQSADSYARLNPIGAVPLLRSEAFHRLAIYHYRHGDYVKASDDLVSATAGHSDSLQTHWPLFHALILLNDGRNQDAERYLIRGTFPDQDAWARYNLGVTEARLGNRLLASGLLETVGTMSANTEEELALRDLANLAMGYLFLAADQGGTARALFKRMRQDGPYSSRALLGAGWAELAPDGNRQDNIGVTAVRCAQGSLLDLQNPAQKSSQKPSKEDRAQKKACDPTALVKQRRPFEFVPGPTDQSERYRRALAPWTTLAQRDPGEPAVQEGLLAIAYVYGRLQDGRQAADSYRRAIAVYEVERKQLTRALEVVRTSPLHADTLSDQGRPWQQRIWDLPRPQDAAYLVDVLTGDSMVAALDDYRDLRRLADSLRLIAQQLSGLNLATVQQGLQEVASADQRRSRILARNDALLKTVNDALARQEQAVRSLAIADLTRHRTRLETYLKQAYFGLARELDPAVHARQP